MRLFVVAAFDMLSTSVSPKKRKLVAGRRETGEGD